MKIVDVSTTLVSCPLVEPVGDATSQWSEWNGIVIRVETDGGVVGIGEVGPLHGREMPIYKSIIEKFRPIITGTEIFGRTRLWNKMLGKGSASSALGSKGAVVTAIGGVDIAIWDAFGKALKTPIYQLLGGSQRSRLPTYASGFWSRGSDPTSVDEAVREAQGYVEKGFKAMKIKIGFDWRRDIEKVKAVRLAVGPDVELMVDANQGFSPYEALKVGRKLEKLDVLWFEEPIPMQNVKTLAKLADALDVAVAGGENEYTLKGFRDIVVEGAVDILQPDCMHAGGISEAQKIIHMADAWDLPVAFHIYSAVGLFASLQLMVASTNSLMVEYVSGAGAWTLREEMFKDPIRVVEGYVEAPKKPGLGFELDEDALAKYSI